MEILKEKVTIKETFIMTLFMTTGLVHPILLVWLSDQGATDPSAMLYILPSYVGKSLCGLHLWYMSCRTGNYSSHGGLECLSPSTSPGLDYDVGAEPGSSSIDVYDDISTRHPNSPLINNTGYSSIDTSPLSAGLDMQAQAQSQARVPAQIDSSVPWGLVALLCTCEISSSCMHMIGLLLSGPTLVTLVYSSITITTALISRVVLGRVLTAQQWFAIVVVAAGVSLSGALHLLPNIMGAHTSTPVSSGMLDNKHSSNALVDYFPER